MKLTINEDYTSNIDIYEINIPITIKFITASSYGCNNIMRASYNRIADKVLMESDKFILSAEELLVCPSEDTNRNTLKINYAPIYDRIIEQLDHCIFNVISNPVSVVNSYLSGNNFSVKNNKLGFAYYSYLAIDLLNCCDVSASLNNKMYNKFSNFAIRFSNHITVSNDIDLFNEEGTALSNIMIESIDEHVLMKYIEEIINSRLKIVNVVNALPEVCTEEEIANLTINRMPTNTSYTYKEFLNDFYKNKMKPKRLPKGNY